MPETSTHRPSPGVFCRIRIEGALDPSWSDRLGGLSITSSGRFDTKTTTVLEGDLRDQAALLGVLNALYEMHLPLESLETNPPEISESIAESQSSG